MGFVWLTGNIRRKLTLFVVLILAVVIGLFWFFSVHMLEPTYQESIQNDLALQIDTVAEVLNKAQADGLAILDAKSASDESTGPKISPLLIERLNDAHKKGQLSLDNRCLEISNQNAVGVLRVDNLAPGCLLHLSYETGITPYGVTVASESDGDFISLVRRQVLENGQYENTVRGQFVLGRLAAGGSLAIIMSANLEQIPQAVNVLRRLLLPLSLLLGLFSLTAAWVFSRWFTRPLSRLSAAAREMGKGNYSVRVEKPGEDEIGDLGRDFNAMASEVGRSYALQRDILANVSHDLRTPLTIIKGYAETVRDLTADEPAKRTAQLNVIVDESDRLSALVGSVLELSRMSSGIEKPENVLFDLSDFCEEISYRFGALGEKQGYKLLFSGQEGCVIYSDPKLLERALDNLLGNAIKHVGKDGYIGLIVFKTQTGAVRCQVKDHGIGIPKEDLPHLFDRYYRSRQDKGTPGAGLGLSIAKAVFETLLLPFGVETAPGQGACFWFEANGAKYTP